MKKKLTLFCLFVLMAGCTTKSVNKEESVDFMVLVDHGAIKQAANGNYELVLDLTNRDKVTVILGKEMHGQLKQPRLRHISFEQFKRLWRKDEGTFYKNPPNAVIAVDKNYQAVIIKEMEMRNGQVIFSIRPDSNQPLRAMEGRVQLFIDQASDYHCCTTVEGMESCGTNTPLCG